MFRNDEHTPSRPQVGVTSVPSTDLAAQQSQLVRSLKTIGSKCNPKACRDARVPRQSRKCKSIKASTWVSSCPSIIVTHHLVEKSRGIIKREESVGSLGKVVVISHNWNPFKFICICI